MNVVRALQLVVQQWPFELFHWRFLDHREISIPLPSGITLESRTAQTLVCQLVLCELSSPRGGR